MAEIPQYQRQLTGGGDRSTGQISGVPYNPGIGEGLQNAGRAVEDLANMGAQHYIQNKNIESRKAKENQDKFDQAQAIRTFSEFQIADQDRQYNFQNTYNGDLTKFASSDTQNLSDFYNNFQTEPLTPGAKDHLDRMFSQYTVQSHGQALDFQAKAIGTQVRSNFEVASNNLINDTRTNPYTNFWNNQEKLNELVKTADGKLPHQALEELKKDYQDRNAIAMIRGKADKNPRQTLQELDNQVYNKILSPDALETVMTGLRHEIESEDKQLQAHYAAEVSGKLDDHLHSLMETNTPVIKQSDIDKIADPYVKQQVQQEFNFNTKVGRLYFQTLKGKEGLPLEQQLANVETLKPKPGSATFADDQQAYDAVRKAVIEQNKQYAEDPVEASLQNGQVAQAWNRSEYEGRRSSITNQLNKGYPFYKLAIAKNSEVVEYSGQINQLIQSDKFEEAKTLMSQLRDKFNIVSLPDGRTGWDIFKDQMTRNKDTKVPDDFLMALQYQDIPQGNDIFQAYKVSRNDYTSLIGDQNIKDVDTAVNKQFSPYAEVLQKIPGFSRSSQLATEKSLLSKYAYRLVQQGQSPNDAAKNAFSTMFQYEIINNNRQQLILPKKIGSADITPSKIQTALSQLSSADLIYSHLSIGIPENGAPPTTLTKLSVPNNLNPSKQLYLRWDAASAFEQANTAMKNIGKGSILVNDAHRTTDEQAQIYANKAGKQAVAKPGHSKHEQGLGLDVQNYAEARPFLEKMGFTYAPGKNDPWHFVYTKGGNYVTMGNMPERLSDTERRKRYADSLSKEGIWKISRDLRSVTLYSKNNDGSITPVYNAYNNPYTFHLVNLQSGNYNHNPRYRVGSIGTKSKKSFISAGERNNILNQRYVKGASQLAGHEILSNEEAQRVYDRGF